MTFGGRAPTAAVRDAAVFHRLAPVYDLFAPRPDADALRAAVGEATGDVSLVVDLAGGTGRLAPVFDARVVVVDAAPGMLRQARDRGVDAVRGDAATLPLRDGAADAVVVHDALHHVPDAAGALAAAARVVRPGGVVVVRDYDPSTLRGRGLAASEHLFGLRSTFRTADEAAALLDAAGLDAAVRDRGFAYTAVGRRPEPGTP